MIKEWREATNQDEATLCLVEALHDEEVLQELKKHLAQGEHVNGLEFEANGDYVSYYFGKDLQPFNPVDKGYCIVA